MSDAKVVKVQRSKYDSRLIEVVSEWTCKPGENVDRFGIGGAQFHGTYLWMREIDPTHEQVQELVDRHLVDLEKKKNPQ